MTEKQYRHLKAGSIITFNEDSNTKLTKGKKYTVVSKSMGLVTIVGDNGNRRGWFYDRFKYNYTREDKALDLVLTANEGRKAANRLLKHYSDVIRVSDGKYSVKTKRR